MNVKQTIQLKNCSKTVLSCMQICRSNDKFIYLGDPLYEALEREIKVYNCMCVCIYIYMYVYMYLCLFM